MEDLIFATYPSYKKVVGVYEKSILLNFTGHFERNLYLF